jgi:hypothetical protein
MGKPINQHHLIFIAELFTGQQRVLCRPAHIQAGDDVQDFFHTLMGGLYRSYRWNQGLLDFNGKGPVKIWI